MSKWTPTKISALKGKEKISAITAYDWTTAKLVDQCNIELILVGDSLAMTVLGHENTLPVTVDEMLHHTKAVVRGTEKALVVADMPFMSYQARLDDAMLNAGRFMKEGHADAVKIEGGAERAELIGLLTTNGIPVMGHIGLTPQSVKAMGYKVQGKTDEAGAELVKSAQAIEQAGAFAIVLEAVPADLAARISASVGIPTIGIGAGVNCDGQILVIHDLLGLFETFIPKFAKQYAQLGKATKEAISEYSKEVKDGSFPSEEHTY